MKKKEIYMLTKHCTNKDQIKALLKGEERETAFLMLKERQLSEKRKRIVRDLYQLDDYLQLPLAERKEKYWLKHIACNLTGIYRLRCTTDVNTGSENKSRFNIDSYNQFENGNYRDKYETYYKGHFNKNWMGGSYNASLFINQVDDTILFRAHSSTFNRHTSYSIHLDFKNYELKNIGGLTTFYKKSEKNLSIKEIYWLHFYGDTYNGANGYSLKLKKGWLIKGYHVELKHDFKTEEFLKNVEASEISIKDKVIDRIKNGVTTKNIDSIFDFVFGMLLRYWTPDGHLDEIKANIDILKPLVPNTHKIKTLDNAIAFVKKQRHNAAQKFWEQRKIKQLEQYFGSIKETSGEGCWVTRADSLAVGNCSGGTDAFIQNVYYKALCNTYGKHNVAPYQSIKKNAVHVSLLAEIGKGNSYVDRILQYKNYQA